MKKICSFTLDFEVAKAVRDEAAKRERSISWMVNHIIRKELKVKKTRKFLDPDKM
jgi:hypothetical protein